MPVPEEIAAQLQLAQGEQCSLHRSHRPEPMTSVWHHVLPLGMGGQDTPENRRAVCDTGRRTVHLLLGPMCQEGPRFGVLPPGGTRAEQDLAREGYERWLAAGKQGDPAAAYGLLPSQLSEVDAAPPE